MPYIVARNGRPYSEPLGVRGVIGWVLHFPAKYRVGGRKPVGRWRVAAQLTRILPAGEEGRLWHVWAWHPDKPVELLIRKVKKHNAFLSYTGSEVDMSKGNPRIQEIAQWSADNYTHIRCNGWLFNRPIAGTDTPSQHSGWPPAPGYTNAMDVAFYKDDTPSKGADTVALEGYVWDLLSQARRGSLPVGKVIFRDKVYNAPNFAPEPYGGTYHGTHAHVEAEPSQTGSPV